MWIYTQARFNPDDITLNGNRFLIGNGYLGFRGTLEEFGSPEKTACILNGVYDQAEGRWREPVNAPNGLSTSVWFRGKDLSVLSSAVASHEQTLDLRQALHRRKTTFACDGALVTVEAERSREEDRPEGSHQSSRCRRQASQGHAAMGSLKNPNQWPLGEWNFEEPATGFRFRCSLLQDLAAKVKLQREVNYLGREDRVEEDIEEQIILKAPEEFDAWAEA
jgi:hypothetical protein